MLPLGLLLVIAAGVAGVAVAMDNTDPATLAAFGASYAMTTAGVFLIGAVVGIVGMTGMSLMVAGAQARRDRRRATKVEVRDARTENGQLAEENARLRARANDTTVTDANDPYPTEADTAAKGKHRLRG